MRVQLSHFWTLLGLMFGSCTAIYCFKIFLYSKNQTSGVNNWAIKTRAQVWLFRHCCDTLLPHSKESERSSSLVQVKGCLGNGDSSEGQDLCVPVMLSPMTVESSLCLFPAGTGVQNYRITEYAELEGTRKDHEVQLLALQKNHQAALF